MIKIGVKINALGGHSLKIVLKRNGIICLTCKVYLLAVVGQLGYKTYRYVIWLCDILYIQEVLHCQLGLYYHIPWLQFNHHAGINSPNASFLRMLKPKMFSLSKGEEEGICPNNLLVISILSFLGILFILVFQKCVTVYINSLSWHNLPLSLGHAGKFFQSLCNLYLFKFHTLLKCSNNGLFMLNIRRNGVMHKVVVIFAMIITNCQFSLAGI